MKAKHLFLIIISLLITSITFAQQPMHGGMGIHHGKMSEMLQLTEEQKEKIDAIHLKASKASIPLFGEINVIKAEIDNLIIAENPNRNQIIKKVQELGSLKSELKILNTLKRIDVRDILTDEQKIKFDQMHLRHDYPNGKHPMRMGMQPPPEGFQMKCGRSKFGHPPDIEKEIEVEEKE